MTRKSLINFGDDLEIILTDLKNKSDKNVQVIKKKSDKNVR